MSEDRQIKHNSLGSDTSLDIMQEDIMEVDPSTIESSDKEPDLLAACVNKAERTDSSPRAEPQKNITESAGNPTQEAMEVLDDEDEASATGMIEARFENVLRYKSSNHKIDHRVISGMTMARCLPWRVLVIFHPPDSNPSIGVFVQANAESTSQTWSCSATANIRLICNLPDGKDKEMKIQHTFTQKENDWGFQSYISYDELFNTERGFLTTQNNVEGFVIQASIKADAPHGADWDSKRHTGFVGLRNQGATCYLNSLLQALYSTNKLRRAVFLMPTESDDAQTSVPLALQRVFFELQHYDRAVGTKKLTRSFGWATFDSFMQHDAQELCRVLLDNLENKMKGTIVEEVIPNLFCGKMLSYIRCINVHYESKREENFYDIQLKVNGNRTIDEAFKEYIAKETLSQDNRYDAGEYGLQDAEKGVIFTKFPPVLYLQLMRFQYDFIADTNVKINDRFEFTYKLNLDDYLLEPDASRPGDYFLHAVLVHSGDNHGGHYVAYINPAGNGVWYQFDDDVVSRCSSYDAITMNFGGTEDPDIRPYTNAYMLVYIAESMRDEVLCRIGSADIPESLRERFSEEQSLEEAKRLEKERGHLFTGIHILLEEDFYSWQGPELCNQRMLPSRIVRVAKQSTKEQLVEAISTFMNYPLELTSVFHFRPQRKNQPASLTPLTDNPLQLASKDINIFYVNCREQQPQASSDNPVHLSPPISQAPPIAPKSTDNRVLFLKYFDPINWTMSFCGQIDVSEDSLLETLESTMRERVCLSAGTPLILFQDDPKSTVVEIPQTRLPISRFFKSDQQGQVIYFQAKDPIITADSSNRNLSGHVQSSDAVINGDEQSGANSNSSYDIIDSSQLNVPRLQHMALLPSTTSEVKESTTVPSRMPSSPPHTDAMSIQNYCASHIHQVEVLLVDKNRPTDPGILLRVIEDLTYWEFAEVAAAYLSTQSAHLQFFRSQVTSSNASGSLIVGTNTPAVVDPMSTSPIGSDSGTGACDAASSANLSTATGSIDGHLSRQEIAARAAGFTGLSPHGLGLISAATAQGLFQEPPGVAILSTHTESMRDFLIPLNLSQSSNLWSFDNSAGAGTLSGINNMCGPNTQSNNQLPPEKFPAPFNRYCGTKIVGKCPSGPVVLAAPRRVYYVHLAIKIDELETMRQVRVFFVNNKLSSKTELLLSVPQNGTVTDILSEASQYISAQSSGLTTLRLLDVWSNRIIREYPSSLKLASIPDTTAFPQPGLPSASHTLRIEEVPADEIDIKSDETIVYVSHFDKEIHDTFGIPFSLRIKDGESYTAVRERIRKRLDVPVKEFERWRFAVMLPNEIAYIPNDVDTTVKVKNFAQTSMPECRPWLGIDHKPTKRPRYNPNQVPVVIYN